MALLYVGKGDAIDDVGNISTAYKILQELFKDYSITQQKIIFEEYLCENLLTKYLR